MRNTRSVSGRRRRPGPIGSQAPPIHQVRPLDVVEYEAFRQRVRRFRREATLRAVAAMAAAKHQADFGRTPPLNVPNYVHDSSLAGVARAATTSANDHRGNELTEEELVLLCGYYANVRDPGADEQGVEQRVRYILGRIAYEQFGFQYSLMENIGRTLAVLIDEAPNCPGAPTAEEWEGALGASLELFMQVGFGLHVAIVQNGGSVARDLLLADHVAPIWDPLTPAEALSIAEGHFIGQPDDMAMWSRRWEVKGYEKWSPNPLQAWPLVALGEDLVGPTPRFIADKITPSGLYFTGRSAFGPRFTDALGCMFERYVGRQLRLLEHATVHPSRRYGKPKKDTTDFFVVTDKVVVLVEVKASRPVLAVRTGDVTGDKDVVAKIGHARDQIDNTADLLRNNDPVVADIPKDRPVVGLVVTLEPWYMTQTFSYEDLLPSSTVPIAITSAHELEGAIATLAGEREVGARFLKALAPGEPVAPLTMPTPPSLRNAADGLEPKRNPILEDGWRRFAPQGRKR